MTSLSRSPRSLHRTDAAPGRAGRRPLLARTARAVVLCGAALGGTTADLDAHQPAPEVAVLAPGYEALSYAAPRPGSYRLPDLGPAHDAGVIDSSGARTTLHDLFAGKVTILAFIYTHCDDVNGCPLATYVMGQVARELFAEEAIAPRLQLVSFSFDPERDTPEVLARYGKSFRPEGAAWRFVTAQDAAALEETLGDYQQSVMQTPGHTFAHVLRVFLIDPGKRVRNIYSTAFLHEETMRADILTLLGKSAVTAETAPSRATAVPPPRRDKAPVPTPPETPARRAGALTDDLGLPGRGALNGPVPTPEQAALGEQLFFDRRLSLNKTISCAMCHVPAQGFTSNELATAVGIEGRTVKRNAPTLLNVGYLERLFHDGRERRLEHQVWSPLLAANEMANPSIGYVLETIESLPAYAGRFEEAFGEPVSMDNVGRALAAFERTLTAGSSDFDRWRYGGEEDALSPAAQRGYALFVGKGNCAACHLVGDDFALFTDHGLHNTGIGYLATMYAGHRWRNVNIAPDAELEYDLEAVADAAEAPPNDLGAYEVTQDPDDRWKFRTPTLRNVALTAPYMHNGALPTLESVVAFYDQGGIPNELLDPRIRPLDLTAGERADLVAFLESLTSPEPAKLARRYENPPIGNP